MLYTSPALGQATGGMLRPGGLELTKTLVAHAGPAPGARLLDVGCGPGHSLAWLAQTFTVCGLDCAPNMLVQAAVRAPAAVLVQGRAEALPFGSTSFNGILAECVLSLCTKKEQVLAEMRRMLRPGGVLVVYVATTTQLSRIAEDLRSHGQWTEPRAEESLVRTWHLEGLAVRPDHRMVGHTGFLLTSRRLADGTVAPPRRRRPAKGMTGGAPGA